MPPQRRSLLGDLGGTEALLLGLASGLGGQGGGNILQFLLQQQLNQQQQDLIGARQAQVAQLQSALATGEERFEQLFSGLSEAGEQPLDVTMQRLAQAVGQAGAQQLQAPTRRSRRSGLLGGVAERGDSGITPEGAVQQARTEGITFAPSSQVTRQEFTPSEPPVSASVSFPAAGRPREEDEAPEPPLVTELVSGAPQSTPTGLVREDIFRQQARSVREREIPASVIANAPTGLLQGAMQQGSLDPGTQAAVQAELSIRENVPGGLPQPQREFLADVVKSAGSDILTRDAVEIARNVGLANDLVNQKGVENLSGSDQLALLNAFVRATDPGNRVTASEAEAVGGLQAVRQQVQIQINRILAGESVGPFDPSFAEDLVNTLNRLGAAAERQMDFVSRNALQQATIQGIPQDIAQQFLSPDAMARALDPLGPARRAFQEEQARRQGGR